MSSKPPLLGFIASSTENLPIAEELCRLLDSGDPSDSYSLKCEVWNDTFRPGDQLLMRLLVQCNYYDFAIFVLGPDDITTSRGEEKAAPRDNLNFELGLFMAHMGPERCILLKPKGLDLKLPSDIAGMIYKSYIKGAPPAESMQEPADSLKMQMLDIGPRNDKVKYFLHWGYRPYEENGIFWATINLKRITNRLSIRRNNAPPRHLVLTAFAGEEADYYTTRRFVVGEPWLIPPRMPGELRLTVDTSTISPPPKHPDWVWGVLFLFEEELPDLSVASCVKDVIDLGGEMLTMHGNACEPPDYHS